MSSLCEHFSYSAYYPDRVPFKVRLQQLVESHDAEIAFLRERLREACPRAVDGEQYDNVPLALVTHVVTPEVEPDCNVPVSELTTVEVAQMRSSNDFSPFMIPLEERTAESTAQSTSAAYVPRSTKSIPDMELDGDDGGHSGYKRGESASESLLADEDDNTCEDFDLLMSAADSSWFEMDSEQPMQYTAYARFCYVIDTWISKRRSQSIAFAGTLFVFVILFGLLWAVCFFNEDVTWFENIFEGLWVSWTFMADPGTHAAEIQQSRRALGALIAASGIIFMAATLGMVVDIIREKMGALRQGTSSVVERNHSLILGWSEKAVSIIEELCFANESDGGRTIVVLSHVPKAVIERDLLMQLPPSVRKGSRVVCRTGNPMLISDLLKVGAPTARATIILSNDGDPDNSDAETLRVMLSLRTLPYRMEGHVVAEVRDIDNEPLVKMVGGHVAETMVSHDVLGRLMLMSARQPGLAKVYESLLGFQGDEFYMREWPDLVDVEFGNLVERFPDAVPIGVCTEGDVLIVNPDRDRPMQAGERIFVIAEDDDTYMPNPPVEIDVGDPPAVAITDPSPEKILFCGWRRDIRDIVVHLDSILHMGSEIHMITASVPPERRTEELLEEGLDVKSLTRLRLVQHYGNPSLRRRLSALPLAEFTSCMIFSDKAYEADTMQADSHSLATLLLLRDLQEARERKSRGRRRGSELARLCPVICEVLDSRTQKTISSNRCVSRSSEFCQTNKITAQILAMVAENRNVNVLFKQLFGAKGNSVNVYPSSRYARQDEAISFWTLAKRTSMMGETLIGSICKLSQEVEINPRNKTERRSWINDNLVVISCAKPSHSKVVRKLCTKPPGVSDEAASFQALLRNMDHEECYRFLRAQETIMKMALQSANMRHLMTGVK